MKPNASITIYHREYDAENREDVYKRKIVKNVYWFDCNAANVSPRGLENADRVVIYAPAETEAAIGDIIARGEVLELISEQYTLKRLKEEHRCVTVTKVDVKDYGSGRLRHIEIGGN